MEIAAPAVLVWKHVGVARGDGGSGGRDRELEQRSRSHVVGFTPIETRVRNENLRSADQQRQEA